MDRPDITPGWQHRMDELRQSIRECRHDGKIMRNEEGKLFCEDCGRRLNDDGSEA